jgi:uncharacterized protein
MAISRLKPRKLRVVLDTNVIVSALVFGGGLPARARKAWQSGAFNPLVSTETANELIRVLNYPKFKLTIADQQELLADYLPYTAVIRIPKPAPIVPECRDPMDIKFLQLAKAARATAIITGDKDLLALASQTSYAILTLEAFFNTMLAAK